MSRTTKDNCCGRWLRHWYTTPEPKPEPTWDQVWNGVRMHKFRHGFYMYYDQGARTFRGPGFLLQGTFLSYQVWRDTVYEAPITNVSEVLTMAEFVVCPQGPLETKEAWEKRYDPPNKVKLLEEWRQHSALVGNRRKENEAGYNTSDDDEGDDDWGLDY